VWWVDVPSISHLEPIVNAGCLPVCKAGAFNAGHLERGNRPPRHLPPVVGITSNLHRVFNVINGGLPSVRLFLPEQFLGGGLQFGSLRNSDDQAAVKAEAVGGV